jgi:multidrug efflux system membrane fusion protein
MLQERLPSDIQRVPREPLAVPPRRDSLIVRIGRNALRVLLPILVLAAAFGVYQWLKSTRPEVQTQVPQEAIRPVSAVAVTRSTYQPTLRIYGETVAGREVELRALVAGKVVEASPALSDGGEIAQGDQLVLIDRFQYEAALAETRAQIAEARAQVAETQATLQLEQSGLERAREQLDFAQRDLQRAAPLRQSGALTEQAFDQRQLTVSQRTEAVEQREINITIQRARADRQSAVLDRLLVAEQIAERNLSDTSLTAPFDAYVSDVNAELGKIISVNDRVATLIDMNAIEVSMTLSDHQYGRIVRQSGTVVGRDVEVRWFVGATPFVYRGRVSRVGSRISSATGGVRVYAVIDDPRAPSPLRPGAFVEVILPDINYSDVVKLPQTSLYDNDHVYVIVDDRLVRRDVETVGAANGSVLVRGNLQPGERVVATRLANPGEGLKVVETGTDG